MAHLAFLNVLKYFGTLTCNPFQARFMRAFLFPPAGQEHNKMVKHAKKIFLASKPAPVSESRFKDRDVFQLGSMSHLLNTRVPGYHDLPGYPEVAPGKRVRDLEVQLILFYSTN